MLETIFKGRAWFISQTQAKIFSAFKIKQWSLGAEFTNQCNFTLTFDFLCKVTLDSKMECARYIESLEENRQCK